MYDEDTMVRSLLGRFGTLALSLTAAPVFPARLVGGLWAAFGHTKTTDHPKPPASNAGADTHTELPDRLLQ